MANALRAGFDRLGTLLERHASDSAIYTHGDTSVNLPVIAGSTTYKVYNSSGVETGGEMIDFLFKASYIDFLPTRGDTITIGSSVYQVMDNGSDGCWCWSDPYRIMYRVHTRAK